MEQTESLYIRLDESGEPLIDYRTFVLKGGEWGNPVPAPRLYELANSMSVDKIHSHGFRCAKSVRF